MTLFRAAFHEAGHAVGADLMGARVEWVSIEDFDGMAGHCHAVPPSAPRVTAAQYRELRRDRARSFADPKPARKPSIQLLTFYLAGPVAQRIASAEPFDWVGGVTDLQVALAIVGGPDGAPKFFAALARTEGLLRARWREVQAVAAALMIHRTIDAEHVAGTLARVRSYGSALALDEAA